MPRETLVPLVVAALAIAAAFGGLAIYDRHEEESAATAADARAAARVARAASDLDELREESLDLMPEVVDGVALGMSVDEVRALRHTRMSHSTDPHDPGLDMFVEHLPSGGQVIYLFEEATGRLVQMQILSLMPAPEAVAPHLTAMNERYGTPTGVWDCPLTGDVPTRRFTWRFAETALSDVFLISPAGISVTLFVTTAERTEASLRRSACHPVAREDLGNFPVAEEVPRAE